MCTKLFQWICLAGTLATLCASVSLAQGVPEVISPEVVFEKSIENGSLSFTLNRAVDINFVPHKVLFFVNFDRSGEPLRLEGAITPVLNGQGVFAEKRRWVAGVSLRPPAKRRKVLCSLLILGEEKQIYFEPELEIDLTPGMSEVLSTDGLRTRLLQKKDTLASWQLQISAQQESLQRLREDASVIGNLGRIIELREEVERVKANADNLERDLGHMREFIKIARTRPLPKNYSLREGDLVRQIAELADAAKGAESQEYQRKTHVEGELQRKLSIIEQTRNDDYDELQGELVRVRRQRMQVEKDKGVSFEQ